MNFEEQFIRYMTWSTQVFIVRCNNYNRPLESYMGEIQMSKYYLKIIKESFNE